MTARTDLLDDINGRDILAGHANRDRTVLVTKPSHFQGLRWLSRDPRPPGERDRSASWLRAAMVALGALSAAAAVVSFEAQYRMVFSAKSVAPVAALEAGIPDVGALIFACLGIALALQGRRAIRARILNLGAVATSVFMNFAAAGHGWRDLAIWVMPPVAYALASDTAIAVVRAWALARARKLDQALADDEATPLALAGRAALYLLRFAVAPPSTLRGGRQALLNATPLPELEAPEAPAELEQAENVAILIGRDPRDDLFDLWLAGGHLERWPHVAARQEEDEAPEPDVTEVLPKLVPLDDTDDAAVPPFVPVPPRPAVTVPPVVQIAPDLPPPPPDDDREQWEPPRRPREGTKSGRLLELAAERYGTLAAIPLADTSARATALAPDAGLHPATARRELRKAVLAAQARGAQ